MLRSIVLLLLTLCSLGMASTRCPILMYHHVRETAVTDSAVYRDLSCPPKLFQDQLNYLEKAGYTPITFLDFNQYLLGRGALPKHPIILSFDDGGADNWSAAQTLFDRHMKGVFFISTAYIGDGHHLTHEQLRRMVKMGMELGSHTVRHLDLPRLTGESLRQELEQSKRELEDIVGSQVISFAYPSGAYNSYVLEAVKMAGYHFARTTEYGIADLAVDPLELPMIRIHNDTTASGLRSFLSVKDMSNR